MPTDTCLIEVVSDSICPWCLVAKKNFDAALPELRRHREVTIVWRPFELNPDMPSEGLDRRSYRSAKFGSWERSRELDAQVATAGERVGLRFRHDLMPRTPNTFASHRLIWLAGSLGDQGRVVEAVLRAYFTEGRDIGDVATLTEIGAQTGLGRSAVESMFQGEGGVREVREEILRARQRHVSGVPTFLVNDAPVFSGALPPDEMVERLLRAVTRRGG